MRLALVLSFDRLREPATAGAEFGVQPVLPIPPRVVKAMIGLGR